MMKTACIDPLDEICEEDASGTRSCSLTSDLKLRVANHNYACIWIISNSYKLVSFYNQRTFNLVLSNTCWKIKSSLTY